MTATSGITTALPIIVLLCVSYLLTACGTYSDHDYVEQAKDYAEQGNLAASVIAYKNALKANPDNTEARWLLGKTYLEVGNAQAAEKELRRAVALGLPAETVMEDLGQALFMQGKYLDVVVQVMVSGQMSEAEKTRLYALRGEAYVGEKDFDKAAREFNEALSITPQSPEGITGLARLAYVQKTFDKARELLGQSLEVSPNYAPGWLLLGDIEVMEGRIEEAEEAYSQSIQNSSRHLEAQKNRALVRVRLGDLDGAAEDIAALKKDGLNPALLSYVQGVLEFNQEQLNEARDSFQQTLNLAEGYIPAMYYLGATNFLLGNNESAIYLLESVIARVPGHALSRKVLAALYLSTGNYASAEGMLLPLIEQFPNDVGVLKLASDLYLGQGNMDLSYKYLEKAVITRPDILENKLELGLGLVSLGQAARGLELLNEAVETASNKEMADEKLVIGLMMSGNYGEAMEAAEKMRAEFPESHVPFNLIGLVYFRMGNQSESVAAFKRAAEISPGDPTALFNLSAIEVMKGNYEQARKYAEVILSHHRDNLRAYLQLAHIENELKRYAAARDWLEMAVSEIPKTLMPRLHLAKYYVVNGRPERSLTLLNEVEAEYQDNLLWLISLGEAQLAMKQPAKAEVTFKKLLVQKPDLLEGHYYLARSYGLLNKTDLMRQELEKVLEIDPEHLKARIAVAGLLLLEDKPDEAQRLLDELKQSEPDNLDIINMEGLVAMKQSRPEEALVLFRKKMEERPDSQTVLDLSDAYLATRDYDAAFAVLKDWLNQHPGDIRVQFRLVNYYLLTGQSGDAAKILSELAEEYPENPLILNSLAWQIRRDEPDRAREYAEKSLQIAPDMVPAMDTLGVILLKQGDLKRALRLLQQAAEKAPDILAIRYHYAQALAKNGDRAESIAILEDILSKGSSFTEKEDARKLLKELTG